MQQLLGVRDLAARLRISVRQVWKLQASHRIPAEIRLSRSVRWRASDIDDWIDAGCPPREQFEIKKARTV